MSDKKSAATIAGKILGTIIGWLIVISIALIIFCAAATLIKLIIRVLGWVFA